MIDWDAGFPAQAMEWTALSNFFRGPFHCCAWAPTPNKMPRYSATGAILKDAQAGAILKIQFLIMSMWAIVGLAAMGTM
eukprot:10419524-Karenia_brevis.AAC.1